VPRDELRAALTANGRTNNARFQRFVTLTDFTKSGAGIL
jgi:hypothetical protein